MIAGRETVVRLVRGALAVAAVALAAPSAAPAAPLTGVDLSTYVRVGRYDLPEPTRTPPPANSLLAQEASSVTYDWDTDSLFVVGDGGTSVVQVDKTGHLINSMTLARGASPQGTEFYDTEGIAYIGGGRFVLAEERYRQIDRFTYVANTTLNRSDVQTVKLGTTIDNIGIEGVTDDPLTSGFVAVKETQPEGIFQTGIDFAAGTATNGSPTTENSVNLFDPALAGLADFSDVFALSNLTTLTGPDTTHLILLSQESGRIVNIDRSGHVASALTIVGDPGNPLSVPDQTDEGVVLDNDGRLYVVNEDGGGDVNHPQLWVYAPSTAPNLPPTAVTLTHQVGSIAEDTSTAARLKVADVAVADDGLGTNQLTVTGPDAPAFEVDASGLYLKAGTALNHTAKPSYTVSVAVDDPAVGSTPDATSSPLTLTIGPAQGGSPSALVITEVSPGSSGNSSYGADWFEVTNTGTGPVALTGFKMDDNSNAFANAVALSGVSSIAPRQSVVFIEGNASTASAFTSAWFGTAVPAGFAIGSYSGSGVGLSTGGDAVNLFDAQGNRVTGVSFGTTVTNFTFDNAARLGSETLPLPLLTTISVAGRNGAFVAGGETGSPGTVSPQATASAGGTVPAVLALTLGAPASFGAFIPGVAKDYAAATTATVISTAGDAALSVSDPATTAPGHLVNGAFSLPQALQVGANGGPLSPVPASLLTYAGPVSNDQVTIAFKQSIAAADALRTGSYAKTLTFTLSTTAP